MIINVWKPIYESCKIVNYKLVDKKTLLEKKGTTAYKVIWTCDDSNCKTPTKKHSISACHLVKEKMSFYTQICRPCQCTGQGNGRYGDRRKWSDFFDEEKILKFKKKFSDNWKGEKNPSKKESVKIKKGQPIINEIFIEQIVKLKNFKLIKINNLNGKKSCFSVECPYGHISKKVYSNFTRKDSKFICEKCFYNSISLNLSDEEIENFKKYSKYVRALTAKTYRQYEKLINPNNLEISKKKYHLDHKYSISEGFKNNVSPFILSSKENLEVVPWKENLSKQTRCSITLDELNQLTNYLSLKQK